MAKPDIKFYPNVPVDKIGLDKSHSVFALAESLTRDADEATRQQFLVAVETGVDAVNAFISRTMVRHAQRDRRLQELGKKIR